MRDTYDVIVVGGGHAGSEAAAAAAQMGAHTLLVTMNLETIGQMSCNPAMGGVAKGQIVREIDALGGRSGLIADRTAIQFRMLNRKKGPAMWSPRTQNDRWQFARAWRLELEQTPGLDFWQEMVHDILIENGQAVGVRTGLGKIFRARAVVLTSGTFMNGVIHVGDKRFGGGRSGERASKGITEQLEQLGFEAGRMKTGTPPRIDGRSIDYSVLEEQPGETPPQRFSYLDTPQPEQQLSCWIGRTTPEAHALLADAIDRSPLYNGTIQSTGPRYCPSIEDKIVRFADKDSHQLFVEPEGRDTVEVYLNGFSSSLPEEVQAAALAKIPGFEEARMFRPGYAIEYDYFPPHQLHYSLETKHVPGLFFAGQINGTTGYEEAGAQGLMAGVNAVRQIRGEDPLVLGREEAYIGVLIDDLINKSTDEPYRMFTSRAEYRILLRQDNADLRLTDLGYAIGLAGEDRRDRLQAKRRQMGRLETLLTEQNIAPEAVNALLEERGSSPLKESVRASKLLSRPEVDLALLARAEESLADALAETSAAAAEEVEIQTKYAGYIEKEAEMVQKMRRLEDVQLPAGYDYDHLLALSHEARQKLNQVKPGTLGQASRISGVSPSDVQVLMVHMGR